MNKPDYKVTATIQVQDETGALEDIGEYKFVWLPQKGEKILLDETPLIVTDVLHFGDAADLDFAGVEPLPVASVGLVCRKLADA